MPSVWRSYHFSNRVPGYVVDDVNLRDMAAKHGNKLLCKQWPASGIKIAKIKEQAALGRHGWYSFAPDKHNDCNNCVTWAINTVNRVLGEVMRPVPNGRIKLAIEMLRGLETEPSA